MHLKSGTYLQGDKYRIISVLGQGGFGITYLAEHELASRNVCIKEFFPKEYYNRDTDSLNASLGSLGSADAMERFKEKFIKEAKTIARLDHPNIIHIHDVFKENNTCYYVMDYIDGESLQSLVKHSGALAESVAKAYMREACAAIEHIHSMRINHLDIKPGNIMVRKSDNRVVVIDFGLAKQYDTDGNQTSSSPVGISHGYAPMEQYKQGGVSEFAPATDVYSLGATLYYLVTGVVPPQASDVAEDGLPELPAHLSEDVKRAIEGAMQSRRKDRVQSVAEFVRLLDCDSAATTTVPPVVAAPAVTPTPIAVPAPEVSLGDSTELGTALGGVPRVDEEHTELGAAVAPAATPEPKSTPAPKNEWIPKYATDNQKSNTKGGGLKKLVFILVAVLLFSVIAGFVSSLFTSSDETQAEPKTDEEKVIELLEDAYVAATNRDADQIRKIKDALDMFEDSMPNYDDIVESWEEDNPHKSEVANQFFREVYGFNDYSEEAYIEEYPAEACCEDSAPEAYIEEYPAEVCCEDSAPEVYYDEYGGYSYFDDYGNLIYVDQYGNTTYYYFDEYGNMYSEDGELVLAASE